ncbi:hypothetical protein QWA68_016205 [Fusarium oxysporum]|nr:hypothetical protein QWA68_016205 [Fusarium oxysporum]
MSPEFSESRLKELRTTLDQWWDVIANMQDGTAPEAWKRMVSYLSPDCVIHGTQKSFHGHAGAIEWLKQLLSFWRIKSRTVSSQGMNFGGMVLTTALEVSLVILGEDIDFSEVVVVTFDENGLIKDYKPYCDPAPILAIIQRKNGNQDDGSKQELNGGACHNQGISKS